MKIHMWPRSLVSDDWTLCGIRHPKRISMAMRRSAVTCRRCLAKLKQAKQAKETK